jgi:hypothetical protein
MDGIADGAANALSSATSRSRFRVMQTLQNEHVFNSRQSDALRRFGNSPEGSGD